ncbi:hypothetical protein CXB37_21515 [Pseudomonas syringae pv. syringae]|nr:hypothetical protein CXB37_21515 [Pseudomonas syringae pv. syringae]
MGMQFSTLRVVKRTRSVWNGVFTCVRTGLKHMKHPSFCHHCAVSLVMQGLQRIDQFLTTGEPEQAIYLGS